MESITFSTTTTIGTTQVTDMAPYVEGNYNMVVYDCQSWARTFVGYGAYWPMRLLNPYAREWDPYTNKAPEQDRCLFLTFSNGYPLNQRQIRAFFTRKFGRSCVEKVYVHKPESKEAPPLFGKVLFNRSSIPAVVMGGRTQVKFLVDNKPLWCKRFDSNSLGRSANGKYNR